MDKYSMDTLLGKVESRFELVIAAARRARQINQYRSTNNQEILQSMPDLNTLVKGNPLTTSIHEIADDVIRVKRTSEGLK